MRQNNIVSVSHNVIAHASLQMIAYYGLLNFFHLIDDLSEVKEDDLEIRNDESEGAYLTQNRV